MIDPQNVVRRRDFPRDSATVITGPGIGTQIAQPVVTDYVAAETTFTETIKVS